MKNITGYFEERQRQHGFKSLWKSSIQLSERLLRPFSVKTTSPIGSGSFFTDISDAVKESHFRSLISGLTFSCRCWPAIGACYDIPHSTITYLLLLSIKLALWVWFQRERNTTDPARFLSFLKVKCDQWIYREALDAHVLACFSDILQNGVALTSYLKWGHANTVNIKTIPSSKWAWPLCKEHHTSVHVCLYMSSNVFQAWRHVSLSHLKANVVTEGERQCKKKEKKMEWNGMNLA